MRNGSVTCREDEFAKRTQVMRLGRYISCLGGPSINTRVADESQALGHINSGRCHFDRGRFSVPGAETADVAASTTLLRGKSGRIQKYSKNSEVLTGLDRLRYSASILFIAHWRVNKKYRHRVPVSNQRL